MSSRDTDEALADLERHLRAGIQTDISIDGVNWEERGEKRIRLREALAGCGKNSRNYGCREWA